MIGLDQNKEIIGWISSNKYQNEPEFPLKNHEGAEKIMVTDMFSLLKS